MNDKVLTMLNTQIQAELSNSNVYLFMASALYRRGLVNTSKFFKKQSEEERGHAIKIIDFLDKNRFEYALGEINAAPSCSDSGDETLVAWLETALAAEQETTSRLQAIAEEIDPEDFISQDLLTYFLNEQIEEEDTSKHRLDQAKLAGSELMFDQYMED